MRKAVVMLDAGFEVVLATVLLMGVAYTAIDEHDFPAPASDLVIAVFALVLYVLGLGLATLVKNDRLGDRVLAVLAAGNGAFALLIAAWALLADGFSTAGRTVAWATVAALVALACSQALVLARR